MFCIRNWSTSPTPLLNQEAAFIGINDDRSVKSIGSRNGNVLLRIASYRYSCYDNLSLAIVSKPHSGQGPKLAKLYLESRLKNIKSAHSHLVSVHKSVITSALPSLLLTVSKSQISRLLDKSDIVHEVDIEISWERMYRNKPNSHSRRLGGTFK